KPASRSPMVARTLSRSRVERASLSSLVTSNTSPGSSRLISLASSARSVFAPDTFSLKIFVQPAAINSASCELRSWPFVLTIAICYPLFESYLCIVIRYWNQCHENHPKIRNFEYLGLSILNTLACPSIFRFGFSFCNLGPVQTGRPPAGRRGGWG